MASPAPASVHAPIRARWVAAQALRVYRDNWRRVLAASWIVLVPVYLLASLAAVEVDSERDTLNAILILRVGGALAGGLAATLAAVLFGGVLDRLVAEGVHGRARRPWREALRSIPYVRLVIASMLVFTAFVVGLLFLVLPGLLAFTLLVLVGPLVGEGRPIVGACRQSVRLVWSRFWTVVAVVTLPMVGRTLLEDALEAWLRASNPLSEAAEPFVIAVVTQGILAATLGAFAGLAEVVLTDALLAETRDLPAPFATDETL